MSSILVTGCAGFIGSTLCDELLHAGHKVIGIDNFDGYYSRNVKEFNLKNCLVHNKFTFYEADITDKTKLDLINEKVDGVIHVAAKAGVRPSIRYPADYILVNILGAQHILDWMLKRNVKKLVFTSSSSIYGNNTPVPFSETANVDHPISPYAFTKKAGELLNHTYHYLYGFDVLNLRLFTVYGERQRPDLAIHKFTRALYNRMPLTIYGAGDTARDYTYVKDIVTGIIAAYDYTLNHKNVYEIINLGNNAPVSLLKLIELLAEITGIDPVILKEEKQPGDMDITFADITKAGNLLGYKPEMDFKQGLKNFTEWYKSAKPTR